jgi:hypothetical protein
MTKKEFPQPRGEHPQQEIHGSEVMRTLFCDAFKSVVADIIKDGKWVNEDVSPARVTKYLNEDEDGFEWKADDLDSDLVREAVTGINISSIMGALKVHMHDLTQMRSGVPPTEQELLGFETLIGSMVRSTYGVGETMTGKWRNGIGYPIHSDVPRDMEALIEATGHDSSTAVALKSLFVKILFQALNVQKSFNNILLASNGHNRSFQPDESVLVSQTEYQARQYSEIIDSELAARQVLKGVPYVKDVVSMGETDRFGWRNLSFDIDPNEFRRSAPDTRRYLPQGFFSHFGSVPNDVEIPEDWRGFSDSEVPGGIGFSVLMLRNQHSGKARPAVSFKDGRYKVQIAVVFDKSLEEQVQVPLGMGTATFSHLRYDRVPADSMKPFPDIPETIIGEYLKFHKGSGR